MLKHYKVHAHLRFLPVMDVETLPMPTEALKEANENCLPHSLALFSLNVLFCACRLLLLHYLFVRTNVLDYASKISSTNYAQHELLKNCSRLDI